MKIEVKTDYYNKNSFLNEYNEKLWNLIGEIERDKDKLINIRESGMTLVEREAFRNELSIKINNFHKEFIDCCSKIVSDIYSKYIFDFITEANIKKMEYDITTNIDRFCADWRNYIHPLRLEECIFDIFKDEEEQKNIKSGFGDLIYTYPEEEKVVINMANIYNRILKFFGGLY